jgi:transposase
MMLDSVAMTSRAHETEVIPVLQRHKIQVLLEAGFSQKEIVARTGASPKTVQRIAAEKAVEQVDDHIEAKTRGIGRPSLTAKVEQQLETWLAEDATTPTHHLLRRAKDAGYTGAKSAFYAMVAAVRPKLAKPVVTFEGMPGEFSQHDFGEVDVVFGNGAKKRVHFFASRLKYSRFACVTIVVDQRAETLIRGLCRDFQAFGGVPLLAVFDRPKTVVLEGDGLSRDVRRFNATFAQAVCEMGVGVEMCAPRSGNQKGTIEAIVKWVKNSFFKGRVFRDEVDLREQLAAWLQETNCTRVNTASKAIPEDRRREELARLRPLGVLPEALAIRIPTSVGPTGHVVFEGARYMMPPEAIHLPATLFVYEDRIRIEAGRYRSEQRRRTKYEPMEAPAEHRAAKVAAVLGARAKLYEQRQQIVELGPPALTFMTEIVHRKRQSWPEIVERLHALLLDHGEHVMREAIARAVAADAYQLRVVEDHVEQLLRAPQSPRPASGAARGAHARGQLGLFVRGDLRARTRGGDR